MSSKKSSITFYDPYKVWPSISEEFMSHLPLRNLHWKSSNRPLRSIQSLQVEMRQYSTSAEEQPHQMPISLLEKPYLNLMLVKCDDNEMYRNQVRKTIREWYNGVVAKRNQEWMILHVVPKSSSVPGRPASRFAMKGSVYDKIRADFNGSKKDRCAQLRTCDTEGEELEMWQDILGKIKEGVLQSFDSRVLQYEEDIRKMDAQRTTPGWNYCTFFILKEGLAQSFEHMFLLEDALIQYDELEASFFQMLRDKQLTWFTRTGGISPGDDSANVLDLSYKDYRTLILANNISLFDFRVYLFARQAFLLSAMGRYADICARARDYIATLARTLRNDREDTGLSFIESWIFSAAMQIIQATRKAPASPAFAAVTGDLQVIARTQLDKIGHHFQLIPESVPFEGSFSDISLDSTETSNVDNFKTTNNMLQEVITDKDKFCTLYQDITLKALTNFQASHRTGSAESMTADLASLYFHQKQYKEAAALLEKLTITSMEHGWSIVDCALMKIYAQCLQHTGDITGHINILLKLLLHRSEIGPTEGPQYIEELEKDLSQSTTLLERPLKDYFTLQIAARPSYNSNSDGFKIKLVITNLLPSPINLTRASLKVISTTTGQDLDFESSNVMLDKGKNVIWITCNTTAPGVYIFESTVLEWHGLSLKQEFVEMGRKQYLSLYPHGNALRVNVDMASEIYLDRPKRIVVSVQTGWNEIVNGEVVVRSSSAGLAFDFAAMISEISTCDNGMALTNWLIEDGDRTALNVDVTKSGIIGFGKVAPGANICFSIPFTSAVDQNELDIEVKYTTANGSYTYFHPCTVNSALPLSVGVTDSFRPKILISIFAVHPTESPLRILNVGLTADKGFDVWNGASKERDLVCIPKSPARFVYQISKVASKEIAQSVSQGHPLSFVVSYRMIEKEIAAILQQGLRQVVKEKGMERFAFRLCEAVDGLVKRVDLNRYGTFRSIVLSEGKELEDCLSDVAPDELPGIQDLAQQFFHMFKDYASSNEEVDAIPRETIHIPADIPSIDVVNTVELSLKKGEDKYRIGSPIQAELSIYSSFNWSLGGPPPPSNIECYYDIHLDPDTWLISGCNRAQFTIQDDVIQRFQMTLIPLRNGVVKIPKVEIEVLTPNIVSEVEDASLPDVVVLPTRFMAVYKVEVPSVLS